MEALANHRGGPKGWLRAVADPGGQGIHGK